MCLCNPPQPAERVFSLLENSFSRRQNPALEDSQYSIPSFVLLQTVQDQRTSCSLCVTSMQTIRGATTKQLLCLVSYISLTSSTHLTHPSHLPHTTTPSSHILPPHTLLTLSHTPSQHIFREPVCASMPNGVNLCLMDGEPVYASMPNGVYNGVNLCTPLCLMECTME